MAWCESKHVHVILFPLNNFKFDHTFLFLYQSRQNCRQFRTYVTFSLLNTGPFCSAGGQEVRHGQTTNHWPCLHAQRGTLHRKGSINSKHKTVRSALSPPSPRTTTTLSRWSYCREKRGGVVFRAVTTSQGRSHFDFIGIPEANLRRVFALDELTRPRANKLHSTDWSSSNPTEKQRWHNRP
jgi:hypothetical protein